jgi:sporulation protein YlmC with PRC-barrel domain
MGPTDSKWLTLTMFTNCFFGVSFPFWAKKRKFFKQDTPIQSESGVKMEKTDKPLTREALVSMQVIDSKGRLVGKVKDIAFAVGKMGIALSVETKDGETKHISWEDVAAAADFIILKPTQSMSPLGEGEKTVDSQPVQAEAQKASTTPICPTCGKPLTWIPQYKRWYCYNDKKYV